MGAISPKPTMALPRRLFWLRAAAIGAGLGLVGVVAVRYGVGFYPDLDPDLAVVRPFQYVTTGAVVSLGVMLMIASLATVVVGIIATAVQVVATVGRTLWRAIRSWWVLQLTNVLLSGVAIAAYASPVVAAIWWSGGWSALWFWVQAALMGPMIGLVALFPAGLVQLLLNPPLRWCTRKWPRRWSSYLDPDRHAFTFYLPWLFFGLWLYGDAAGAVLEPGGGVRLPHPHPALGVLILAGVVAGAIYAVSWILLVLGREWRTFYENEKRRHQAALPAPAAVPASPALKATEPPEVEPEELWSPEAAVGWRAWRVVDGGVLHGMRQRWPSDELESRCSTCPESPGYHCSCGIYAVKERWQLLSAGFAATVVGRVELSGLVIEHERGYRAQRARIVELYAPDDFVGRQLRAWYDCPVRIESLEFGRRKDLHG